MCLENFIENEDYKNRKGYEYNAFHSTNVGEIALYFYFIYDFWELLRRDSLLGIQDSLYIHFVIQIIK